MKAFYISLACLLSFSFVSEGKEIVVTPDYVESLKIPEFPTLEYPRQNHLCDIAPLFYWNSRQDCFFCISHMCKFAFTIRPNTMQVHIIPWEENHFIDSNDPPGGSFGCWMGMPDSPWAEDVIFGDGRIISPTGATYSFDGKRLPDTPWDDETSPLLAENRFLEYGESDKWVCYTDDAIKPDHKFLQTYDALVLLTDDKQDGVLFEISGATRVYDTYNLNLGKIKNNDSHDLYFFAWLVEEKNGIRWECLFCKDSGEVVSRNTIAIPTPYDEYKKCGLYNIVPQLIAKNRIVLLTEATERGSRYIIISPDSSAQEVSLVSDSLLFFCPTPVKDGKYLVVSSNGMPGSAGNEVEAEHNHETKNYCYFVDLELDE